MTVVMAAFSGFYR
jgi:putative Ca2+/H+ antiporter (TMEM165/GDT1 family)